MMKTNGVLALINVRRAHHWMNLIPSAPASRVRIPSFHMPTNTLSLYRPLSVGLAALYRIEVSNADRPDATKLTVRGPDVHGIMATMALALAKHNCSIIELHAGAYRDADTASYRNHLLGDGIEDIFYVTNYETGKPFGDDELQELGQCLLDALKAPMKVLSTGKPVTLEAFKPSSDDVQITVIPSSEKK
jgi:hypothetical protein